MDGWSGNIHMSQRQVIVLVPNPCISDTKLMSRLWNMVVFENCSETPISAIQVPWTNFFDKGPPRCR